MNGITLIKHVWDHSQTSIGWETLNHSLYHALQIGIATRMQFAPSDFDKIQAHYRPSYWLGEHGFERPYAEAIAYGNDSFIKAFEAWADRPAFFANNVNVPEPYPRLIHRLESRQRSRLCMWATFGDGWKVTSMAKDHIVACKYENGHGKLLKRKRWTREMLREAYPAPKKPVCGETGCD